MCFLWNNYGVLEQYTMHTTFLCCLGSLQLMKTGSSPDLGKKCLHHLAASLPQCGCINIHFLGSQVNCIKVITFLCNHSKTERAIYSAQMKWKNVRLCDSAGLFLFRSAFISCIRRGRWNYNRVHLLLRDVFGKGSCSCWMGRSSNPMQ